jgi:dTMP kinase
MYVTVEGIDGTGKTTLVRDLEKQFPDALATVEPTDDMWTGEAVRESLRRDTGPMTDMFLQLADRAEHLHTTVVPALDNGMMVISDRSSDSTVAYHEPRVEEWLPNRVDAYEWVRRMTRYWDVEPDLTLWLDAPVDVVMDRVSSGEKYEREERLKRVRDNYVMLAQQEYHRYERIDATHPPEGVLDLAVEAIEEKMTQA